MPDKDPRFEIENDEMKDTMRRLGIQVNKTLPQGWGFTIFLFEYSGSSMFWISSANRQDMIKALREFIKKEEGN
jgi:hypothetical protein